MFAQLLALNTAIADARVEIPWCLLPKPGFSVVLVHNSNALNGIRDLGLVPPGATVQRCRWWNGSPEKSRVAVWIGAFPNPQNARANANEIMQALALGDRQIEVYENKRLRN